MQQKRYVKYRKCKKEQTKPKIKHPKHIHGLHQEDTINMFWVSYSWFCLLFFAFFCIFYYLYIYIYMYNLKCSEEEGVFSLGRIVQRNFRITLKYYYVVSYVCRYIPYVRVTILISLDIEYMHCNIN